MHKLSFDAVKYGKELLIDTADVTTFLPENQVAIPSFYILMAIEKGKGMVHVDDHQFRVKGNTFCFIRPGNHVDISALSVTAGFWIFFPGAFLDSFFNDTFFTYKFDFFHGSNALQALPLSQADFIPNYQLVRQIHDEIQQLQVDSEHVLRSSLYLLLIQLNRLYAAFHGTQGQVIQDVKVLQFKHNLQHKIRQYATVGAMADALGISRTHLNQLSQRYFGRTAKRLLQERLLVEAKQMILFSDQDIAQIAYQLGFSDPSNFNRFFKSHLQETPNQYRSRFSK